MHATHTIPSRLITTMTIPPVDDLVVVTTSFDEVYRREYPALVAVATALTGSFDDGEDLVQGTMLKAYVHWGKVQRLERPGGWCHRVLINACRNLYQRTQTAARWLARQRRIEATSAAPSADVIAFWSAVRRLPERPRQVMALYYAGDHSVEEVARILSVPEGTVRSDLSRARQALQHDMEHDR